MPTSFPLSTAARALRTAALAAGLAALLVACGGGGGGTAPQEIRVRVLHLASDAPRVNVLVDNRVVRSLLDYKVGTGFLSLTSERGYDFAVDVLLPSGSQRVIELDDRSLSGGTEYTIVAVGKTANNSIEALEFDNPISRVPTGDFRVQLLHAAPDAGLVDIYLTEPDADLAASAAVATLGYRERSDRTTAVGGSYRVRITPVGEAGPVLFDSGTLSFPAGRDLLVAVVPNTGPGAATVSLVVDNGAGQNQVLDTGTPVNVRVLHLSSNTPEIVVTADPVTEGAPDIDLTVDFPAGLAYTQATAYQVIPPDRYTVRATEFATPDTVAFTFSQTYVPGSRVSALLVGRKATETTASTQAPVTLFDSVRSVNQIGQVRFVNASSTESRVDVYVVAPDGAITGQFPVATGVGLGSATAYLQFAPGGYALKIARASTTTEIASLPLDLGPGGAITVFAYDTADTIAPVQLREEADIAVP